MSRLLVVDDHPVVREGLEKLIVLQPDLDVCGSCDSIDEGVRLVVRENPDLVLSDMSLAGKSATLLINQLRASHPDLPVLVVSMHDELVYAERILRSGGRGFVSKIAPIDILLGAIRRVLNGGIFVSDAVARSFLQSPHSESAVNPSFLLERLTKPDLEIFELIGRGCGKTEIAERLRIEPSTVDARRVQIREKLGLLDESALSHHAIRWIEASLVHA